MSFAPFMQAETIIQVHASCASLALLLGPFAIYQKRKSRMHKIIGYIWVSAMAITAISAFGIHSFALLWGLSPIHGLAALALWSLWRGMSAIFRGDIGLHQAVMKSLYWHGLCFAGLFNFLPGRMVNRMLFDDSRTMGFLVIGIGLSLILARAIRNRVNATQIPA